MSVNATTRKIGGHAVPQIGYGAMGLAAFYGTPKTQKECDAVFSHLIKNNCLHWDSSDIYSSNGNLGQNEEQIGTFFRTHPGTREKVFIATKHVFTLTNGERGMRGGKDYAIEAANASLKRLGTDHIDLFYAHRPVEPVEDGMRGMKQLKEEGKIRAIGVSEYSLDQLRRANEVAHIDALQIELSPWTPDVVNNGILEWCRKNGTALVAYSPIGRGFLSGEIKSPDDFEESDFRKFNPRFQGENFKKNLELVEDIRKIAKRKNATPAQVALAWVLAQGDNVLPIPGSTRVDRIDENLGASQLQLSKEDLAELDGIINSFKAAGDRYPEAFKPTLAF